MWAGREAISFLIAGRRAAFAGAIFERRRVTGHLPARPAEPALYTTGGTRGVVPSEQRGSHDLMAREKAHLRERGVSSQNFATGTRERPPRPRVGLSEFPILDLGPVDSRDRAGRFGTNRSTKLSSAGKRTPSRRTTPISDGHGAQRLLVPRRERHPRRPHLGRHLGDPARDHRRPDQEARPPTLRRVGVRRSGFLITEPPGRSPNTHLAAD
jgi:hypothetical protein